MAERPAELPARVVLASGSPRRLELLRRIGIEPHVRPADVDETPRANEAPNELVARLARTKAHAVDRHPEEIVLAADTVVVLDAVILGKPRDDADARRMLRALSGRSHDVVTGVHAVGPAGETSAVETTEVTMRPIADHEIAAYVATGEPADKAGAYAIQGRAGAFVTGIVGSDTNVIGLPLATAARMLGEVGPPAGVDPAGETQT